MVDGSWLMDHGWATVDVSGITVPRRLSDTGWLQPGARRRGLAPARVPTGRLPVHALVWGAREPDRYR